MLQKQGKDYLQKYMERERKRVDKYVTAYRKKHGIHPFEALFGILKDNPIDPIAFQRDSRGWY